MRINRDRSRRIFRKQRQRGGCLPFLLLIGVTIGVGWLTRDWWAQWLGITMHFAAPSLQQARSAFDAGNLDTTVTMTTQLINDQPGDNEALALLVRALVYRSYEDYDGALDRQTALTTAKIARQRDPLSAATNGIYAYALQANQQSSEATEFARLSIERDPLDVPARLALALAYAGQGAFDAALREAQRGVEIADGTRPAWRMDARRVLAVTYSNLGRYDDAITTLKDAIDLHPRLLALHFERALYALHVGDNSKATAAYFQVVALDAGNAKARLRLCELSSKLREPEAAVNYCREALANAPTWAEAWYQLGWEYFLQGDMSEAQTALNKCSTLQTMQNVPVAARKFECWYLQGQAAEARGDCDALLKIYGQFRQMAATTRIPQTWMYPPEGPPMCVGVER